ncbi:molybdopterin-dependent oxidoreductase [Geodermatophilus sabuli]|uniref:Molybdopterin-dependent oxidoreductase n=1 Tax=Geodermatophilus sabuli TaxID=1564158 RepID=A0A7K3VWY4_9ACTN|nr:molybdopterin-dependent oxidoreductase [Geodermatophilus sabuli]NEK56848.1 molybdopterin-dependent oxidoreductase [Geodermatophilus sabuli]
MTAVHRTYCRFCLAGCGLLVHVDGPDVVKVKGDPDHPVSGGYTCPKGRSLATFHHSPERLNVPTVVDDGAPVDTDWDGALDDLATRLTALIRGHGPDSVALYLGFAASLDTAGRRYARKFLDAIGSKSLYTATTVDMPCKPLISELMTGFPGLVSVVDYERTSMVLYVGTNPAVSHGQTNSLPQPTKHLREITKRGGEIWVIDPRRSETTSVATSHLQPRPGGDVFILGHCIRELLIDGADRPYLEAHASGVDALTAAVEPFDRAFAARGSGLEPDELDRLVAALRRHGRFSGQTGTGVTMSRWANLVEWLMYALGAITGSLDREGGSWFHPGFLHQLDRRPALPMSDGVPDPGPASRPELPRRWGEYPCAALPDEMEAGNVRALIGFGGNPLTAVPNTSRMLAALQTLDVLVSADVVHSATGRLATHVLPCTGQLERADVSQFTDQGYMTVSAQYTQAVLPPTAGRKPGWWIFAELGRRMGHPLTPSGVAPDDYTDDDVLAEVASRGRAPLAELRAAEGAIVSERAVIGWVHDRVLPDGRWRLAPSQLVDHMEVLQDPADLVLIPRRQLRHQNSQLTSSLYDHRREDLPQLLINPADAEQRHVEDGQSVRIASAAGDLEAIACVSGDMRPGVVSLPHGFGSVNVNTLVLGRDEVDPLTGLAFQSGFPVEVVAVESPARTPPAVRDPHAGSA